MNTTPTAKSGDSVKVHYTGTLDDGSVFDSSEGRDPLVFTVGSGQVIAGFDEAVDGMQLGETKEVRIPTDEAYGPRRDDLVIEIDREQIPASIEVEVGSRLQVQQPDGRAVPVTVTEIGTDAVTLDANHPLAGQALTFRLELVAID